ncbi:hypothetical protein G7Y89_g4285 [Cudoniella acicularis]|uniref:Uncharacterized protein n=1 Tax=Cudoniella acicularis TaxID=354080 RepID=A0A8H4W6V0_9HELO|nr:hypothetical protein G7Y89_g4285 [Cudoniella acicularis]
MKTKRDTTCGASQRHLHGISPRIESLPNSPHEENSSWLAMICRAVQRRTLVHVSNTSLGTHRETKETRGVISLKLLQDFLPRRERSESTPAEELMGTWLGKTTAISASILSAFKRPLAPRVQQQQLCILYGHGNPASHPTAVADGKGFNVTNTSGGEARGWDVLHQGVFSGQDARSRGLQCMLVVASGQTALYCPFSHKLQGSPLYIIWAMALQQVPAGLEVWATTNGTRRLPTADAAIGHLTGLPALQIHTQLVPCSEKLVCALSEPSDST